MHDEPTKLFREAIIASLPHLQPLTISVRQECWVWHKLADSAWSGSLEPRPDIDGILRMTAAQVEEICTPFCEAFSNHHPDDAARLARKNIEGESSKRLSYIVQNALRYLWRQHGTFELSNSQVEAVVQEFAELVACATLRYRYQAPLINFSMPADSLSLPEGLVIRRLSEDEVSYFQGGTSPVFRGWLPHAGNIREFVLECELEVRRGQVREVEEQTLFDKAILALRTFKAGPVGCDFTLESLATFDPTESLCGSRPPGKQVPHGSYVLTTDECDSLRVHAQRIFACTEPAMVMACSRLADAENRFRVEDRIVDAVIGMEALLLAANDGRNTELRFRFSLNYAMLFPKPERRDAFSVARSLYDLRSKIAHGASVSSRDLKIKDKKLSLAEAASRATTALRTVIMHFLPVASDKPPQYHRVEFWESAYFDVQDP